MAGRLEDSAGHHELHGLFNRNRQDDGLAFRHDEQKTGCRIRRGRNENVQHGFRKFSLNFSAWLAGHETKRMAAGLGVFHGNDLRKRLSLF